MTTPLVEVKRITSGSVELLSVWLDSHGTATLSSQPVSIALLAPGATADGTTTWISATWAGSAGTARAARILMGPSTSNVVPKGDYDVWSRVVDNPEIPETFHGRLTVY